MTSLCQGLALHEWQAKGLLLVNLMFCMPVSHLPDPTYRVAACRSGDGSGDKRQRPRHLGNDYPLGEDGGDYHVTRVPIPLRSHLSLGLCTDLGY